ncbi:hypothetical protein WN48_04328 [Eufriesea mexicana]|nr:hypothetical protein WN48_04328 [Eufriesea mexicana]
MSKDTKFFVRPKVRFCQTDAGKSTTKELKNSIDQKTVKQPNKPKIKSIVTLTKPVKLVKLNERSDNCENKNTGLVNNISSPNLLCANTLPPCIIETSSGKENPIKVENQIPLNDANNIQNIKANSKEIAMPKTSIKPLSNDVIASTDSSIEQGENIKKILKSENGYKSNSLKKDCIRDLDILKHKNRLCSVSTATKKSNVTNKVPLSSTIKKNVNSKSVVNVMPCYKYSKSVPKIKGPFVKKTMIRDIIGPKIKPYIGPGKPCKQTNNLKIPENDENTHLKSIISGEKLARPEYNSIICTINKLNEMKQQKVITDIEHLPASYKNLINAKVSTALDFPLDEIVYKNLVDLSIDDNQLPSRLIRSKDPEPQQKDVIPKLSDFFTPISTDEYCTPVSIKPRSVETTDNWSAFRISDQICEWKQNLDLV